MSAIAVTTVESELALLRRQVRRLTEQKWRAFDQGFEAATTMAEAGATPARLRQACGVPHSVPGDIDTDVDFSGREEDTLVDAVPFALATARTIPAPSLGAYSIHRRRS